MYNCKYIKLYSNISSNLFSWFKPSMANVSHSGEPCSVFVCVTVRSPELVRNMRSAYF